MMKTLFFQSILLLAGIAVSVTAGEYKSKGFCAQFSKNGIIQKVTCDGKIIFTDVHLYGEYSAKKTDGKIDTRLIQGFDFEGEAKYKIEGSKTTVTTDSVLGNKQYPKAAKYVSVITMTPDEIRVKTTVTLLTALDGHEGLFYRGFNIPVPLVVNRGIRWTDRRGEEQLKTVPPEFRREFKPEGKEIVFSLPGKLLKLEAGKNCVTGFWDSRKFKAPFLSFVMRESTPFSVKKVTFPKGKIFEWDFKFVMEED